MITTRFFARLGWRLGLVILLLCAVRVPAAHATAISIDLGAPGNITSQFETSFEVLDGTKLKGQTLSLDFLFSNPDFVRLFSITDPLFGVLITLQTNGSGDIGFLDGTGFLLDKHGSALEEPEPIGSASKDGSLSAGLFPLLSGHFSSPIDFFGVHTDLILPSSLHLRVTGAEFQLVSATAFGIGPGVPRDIVPDSGNTLLLLTSALIAVLATRHQTLSNR